METVPNQRFLDEVVEPLLAEHRPDIVRIDPLLAYMGGDVNLASDTGKFLRNGLNPLLSKYGCAAILVHHTPKANNRDTTNYRPSDWQYAGAGSADITNWTRGMLIFEPTHAAHVFKLIAAKRGRRLGWIDAKGEPTLVKYYCHSTTGDGIFWLEATHEDIEAMIEASPGKSKSAPKTKEDLIALVPPKATISKDLLIKNAQDAGIGANRARTLLKEAVEDKDLFEWNIKRSGTGPEKRIARHEQGTFGL